MKFSVIIPTYNRFQSLERTLQSIFRQEFNDFELIVVNDGSNDETDSLLQWYKNEGKLIYLHQPRRGPSSARNRGIAIAKGEYIAFTDDDCVVPPNWLTLLESALTREHADAIGGAAMNCVPDNFLSGLSQEITNHFVTALAELHPSTAFLTSNNVAYRTETIRTIGGFDERFHLPGGEERALHWSILALGKQCTYAPEIIIEHYHIMSLRKYLRQQWNYGHGSYILYKIVGKENTRLTPIPFSVHVSLVKKFFQTGFISGLIKTFFFCLGQAVVACGFMKEALSPSTPSGKER